MLATDRGALAARVAADQSSFPYHEPATAQLLILTSFLCLLNAFGALAQWLLSAGLIGQILIGVIFGTPLAGWMEDSWQETFVTVGYVGLLLAVFEGGMSSSLSNITSLIVLSTIIALTGLLLPIALSFILMPMAALPATHAFAAGSALSSTSLGTVLSVLQPNSIGFDLRKTKVGTALLSAAVLDDIVAFILVKILGIIGAEDTGGSKIGANVGRTLGVTFGLGLILAAVSKLLLKPAYTRMRSSSSWSHARWGGEPLLIGLMTLIFAGMIAASGYGGTSPLFGSYISGLAVAYLTESGTSTLYRRNTYPPLSHTTPAFRSDSMYTSGPTLHSAFQSYITPLLNYLLLPIFFGSIGYSVPFIPLWRGRVIWRGVAYCLLMMLGKGGCGLWLLVWKGSRGWRAAAFLSAAMIARGEIGLLISQVARHTDNPLLAQDEFLIVTWSILLCTIVGPMVVGSIVKRSGKGILEGGWD